MNAGADPVRPDMAHDFCACTLGAEVLPRASPGRTTMAVAEREAMTILSDVDTERLLSARADERGDVSGGSIDGGCGNGRELLLARAVVCAIWFAEVPLDLRSAQAPRREISPERAYREIDRYQIVGFIIRIREHRFSRRASRRNAAKRGEHAVYARRYTPQHDSFATRGYVDDVSTCRPSSTLPSSATTGVSSRSRA